MFRPYIKAVSMSNWKEHFGSPRFESLMRGLIDSTRRLYRYLDLMENTMYEMGEYQHAPLTDKEAEGLNSEERTRFDNDYDITFDREDFQEVFYQSFAIGLYSRIEKELLSLCEVELDLKLIVSPYDSEFIGKGIARAHKFLTQSTGYSITKGLWQELQNVGKVRNRLIHNELPFFAPSQKVKDGNIVKIHIERDSLIQDYYLQIDNELYNHVTRHKIFHYYGAFTEPDHEYAVFDIKPTIEYCRYLIDLRRNLFYDIYKGLLEIAKAA